MWRSGLGVLLLATVFVRNLYCRFLCPVGAALGILSNLTVFRIKRWSECNTFQDLRKDVEGERFAVPRLWRAKVFAVMTASGCTWIRRSVHTGFILLKRKGGKVIMAPAP